MKITSGLLALLLAACASAASAQFAPETALNAPMVSDLVVRAYGGPPWWKVSDGDTTVYIVADPGLLPPDLAIDRTLLERRVKGANEVILAPRFKDGLIGQIQFSSASGRLMGDLNRNNSTALEASLPAALRQRFMEARIKAGQAETRYGALPPGLAGMALAGDYDAARHINNDPRPGAKSFERIVMNAAKAAKVRRIQPARSYGQRELKGIYSDFYKPGLPCLVSALDSLETLPPNRRDPIGREAAIRAWAEGDVAPMLERVRGLGRNLWFVANGARRGGKTGRIRFNTSECINAMPTVTAISRSYIQDQVDAVTRALGKPGHAIAVFDPVYLLTQDGILDRLRRQGFKVTAPDDMAD